MKRATLQAMRQADVRPELIYAYIKTGRIVTDLSRLSRSEANEYTDSIKEFREQVGQGFSAEELIETDIPAKYLRATLQHAQIVGGYYIDKYMNSGFARNHSQNDMNAEFVVSFAFVSFIKCLRTIHTLLEEGISYDANYLVRALYENYLKIRYIYFHPSYADEIIEKYLNDLKSGKSSKDEQDNNFYKTTFAGKKWLASSEKLSCTINYIDPFVQ